MGKKRKGDAVGLEGSTKKKRKKSKHKHSTAEGLDVVRRSAIHRPIKLKIKLGDQLISSSETTIDDPLEDSSPGGSDLMGGASGSSIGDVIGGSSLDVAEGSSIPDEDIVASDVSIGKDEFASSEVEVEEEEEEEEGEDEEEQEEEAWLDALESGEVNERGYLPEKRELNTLTARQRAMLGGEDGSATSSDLLALPTGRSSEEMSEEMLLKKTETNRKRRLAAQKRKEKRKAETVRKLLEKQCTKKKDEEKVRVCKNPNVPLITYISKQDSRGEVGCTLSLPPGMQFPISHLKSRTPPPLTLCAVEGCTNPKKYSDSLTKLPLCSLQCYMIVRGRAEGQGQRSPAVA